MSLENLNGKKQYKYFPFKKGFYNFNIWGKICYIGFFFILPLNAFDYVLEFREKKRSYHLIIISILISIIGFLPLALFYINNNIIYLYIFIVLLSLQTFFIFLIYYYEFFTIISKKDYLSRRVTFDFASIISILLRGGSARFRFYRVRKAIFHYLCLILNFSLINFFIFKINPDYFHVSISNNANFIDFLYYSLLLIAGGQQGRIVAISSLTIIISIIEILLGLFWIIIILGIIIPNVFNLNEKKYKRPIRQKD